MILEFFILEGCCGLEKSGLDTLFWEPMVVLKGQIFNYSHFGKMGRL